MKHFINIKKNALKIAALLILLVVATTQSFAVTYRTSTGSGAWSTSGRFSTSGSGTPTVFVIRAVDSVTLDVAVSGIDTLYINGKLIVDNKILTMNTNGKIFLGMSGSNATIKGGTAAGGFAWVGSSQTIKGPFNGSNTVTGQYRYATAATATAAVGDPNTSFVSFTLAVEVVTFTVNSNSTNHVATWTAAGTPAGDKFLISISSDGSNFSRFAQVNATGEGDLQTYTCNVPKNGKTLYIKLSVISSGNTHEFKTLLATDKAVITESVKIFPTLIGSDVNNLTVVLPNSGTYNVNIFDASLRVIGSATFTSTQPNEMKVLDANASGLTYSGTYYIVVSGAEGIISRIPVVVRK